MAGTGAYALVIEQALALFGISFPEGTIGNVLDALVTIVGFGFLVIGTVRRKDLKYGIVRK